VDARRPPRWVVAFHATDQLPNLFTDLGPTALSPSPRPPSPEQTKPSAMPRHHSIRVHHDQRAGPSGPPTTERNPEQSVEALYARLCLLAFEHDQLLAQRRDLETGAVPGDEECAANVRTVTTSAILLIVLDRSHSYPFATV
jgi:hypothetical protein